MSPEDDKKYVFILLTLLHDHLESRHFTSSRMREKGIANFLVNEGSRNFGEVSIGEVLRFAKGQTNHLSTERARKGVIRCCRSYWPEEFPPFDWKNPASLEAAILQHPELSKLYAEISSDPVAYLQSDHIRDDTDALVLKIHDLYKARHGKDLTYD